VRRGWPDRRSSRRRWIPWLTAVALLAAAGPARAHPSLLQSAPAGGVVADAAPQSIVLSFTEEVEPAGSSIRLTGPGGRRVPMGAPAGRGPTVLAARPRAALATGVYEARWVALGPDGHTISGRFRFGVPGRGGAAPPDVERLDAPGLAGAQASPGDPPGDVAARWLGIVAAGVLLAGALLRWRVGAAVPERRWSRLRSGGLAAALVAAVYAVAAAAGDGAGGVRDALLGEPTGQLALVRLAVLAAVALLVVARRLPRSDAVLGAAGAGALYTHALDGHLQTVEDGVALAYVAQVAHVLAAGVWAGGLVVLATGAAGGRAALRAFAAIAGAAVVVLAGTGLVAAVREVDEWHVLRWTDYGRVVLAKSVLLVVLVAAAGATLLALRRGRPVRWPLRGEAAGVLVVVVLAATLAGLVPGRGQPPPAQRGNLLAGVGFGTVSTGSLTAHVTLAPARPGDNVLALTATDGEGDLGTAALRSVRATLTCRARRARYGSSCAATATARGRRACGCRPGEAGGSRRRSTAARRSRRPSWPSATRPWTGHRRGACS
jgi:copper transport protein